MGMEVLPLMLRTRPGRVGVMLQSQPELCRFRVSLPRHGRGA